LIVKITACAILTALFSMMLKNQRPELSLIIGFSGGTLILLMAAEPFAEAAAGIGDAINTLGDGRKTLSLALKIMGIAILSEMGSGLCRDAGLSAAAMKTELAGKVIILGLMLPTVKNLLVLLGGLLT